MLKISFFLIISSLILFSASCSESSRTVKSSDQPSPAETLQPKTSGSPADPAPQKTIDADKVTSITVEAGYKNYFEQDSKCRKSYDELFGNNDGYYSNDSPCTGKMSVDRDGTAIKTVELNRYDKNTKRMQTVEKSTWNAKISDEEFKAFTEEIISDDFIKNYPEGLEIYTSNFNVVVSQGTRTKRSSGNADDKNPQPISVIESFKRLDGELKWTKVE